MRMCGRQTGLAVLFGFLFLCSRPVYAQTVPAGGLTEVFAGILSIIGRSKNWQEEGGQNLDGSLKWEYIEGEETYLRRMSFKGFRYYVVMETKKRIVALSGVLELDGAGGFLNGGVTVKGIPAVSSLDFAGYSDYGDGTVKVNGSPYDNDAIEEIFRDAEVLLKNRNVISEETEAVAMFGLIFASVLETDLLERLGHMSFDSSDVIPPGITGSNPQGTVKMTTQKDAFEIVCAAYKPGRITFGSPVLDGQFVMGLSVRNPEEVSFDGAITIKNMPFVSSMGFDACVLNNESDGSSSSGSVIINGTRYDFQRLVKSANAIDVPFAER